MLSAYVLNIIKHYIKLSKLCGQPNHIRGHVTSVVMIVWRVHHVGFQTVIGNM